MQTKEQGELEDFIKPVREEQVWVQPRSWEPEDESHDAFKIMIIESFADKSFNTLTHVCHDLALKCINWFGTPGADTYTVIMTLVREDDYAYHERLNQVWGSYAEYKINSEYILVFKDGLREGEEQQENLTWCLDVL